MTKAQLMRHFGVKLLDALIQYLADELGKTDQQVVDGIVDKLCDTAGDCRIEDYDWMDELP